MSDKVLGQLVATLRNGTVQRPKRWTGDTHMDLGGTCDEGATDALMAEAADALHRLAKANVQLRQAGDALRVASIRAHNQLTGSLEPEIRQVLLDRADAREVWDAAKATDPSGAARDAADDGSA